jgi:hypothetical protein
MGGIRVEEAAAVVANELDRLLARDRPNRITCFAPSSVVASTDALSVCGTPSAANARATRSESGKRM